MTADIAKYDKKLVKESAVKFHLVSMKDTIIGCTVPNSSFLRLRAEFIEVNLRPINWGTEDIDWREKVTEEKAFLIMKKLPRTWSTDPYPLYSARVRVKSAKWITSEIDVTRRFTGVLEWALLIGVGPPISASVASVNFQRACSFFSEFQAAI